MSLTIGADATTEASRLLSQLWKPAARAVRLPFSRPLCYTTPRRLWGFPLVQPGRRSCTLPCVARLDYQVERMDCFSRVDDVLRLVSKLPGARQVTADAATGRLSLDLDETLVPRTTLENNLLLLGYQARGLSVCAFSTAPAPWKEPQEDRGHDPAVERRAEREDALPDPAPWTPRGGLSVLAPAEQTEHCRLRTRWGTWAVLAVLVLLMLVCEGSTWLAGRGHLL